MNNIIDFIFGSTFSWLLALCFSFAFFSFFFRGGIVSFRLQLLANTGELSDLGILQVRFRGYPMLCYASDLVYLEDRSGPVIFLFLLCTLG